MNRDDVDDLSELGVDDQRFYAGPHDPLCVKRCRACYGRPWYRKHKAAAAAKKAEEAASETPAPSRRTRTSKKAGVTP